MAPPVGGVVALQTIPAAVGTCVPVGTDPSRPPSYMTVMNTSGIQPLAVHSAPTAAGIQPLAVHPAPTAAGVIQPVPANTVPTATTEPDKATEAGVYMVPT